MYQHGANCLKSGSWPCSYHVVKRCLGGPPQRRQRLYGPRIPYQDIDDRHGSCFFAAASADALGSADLPPDEQDDQNDPFKVFPRRKERDPYKLLGIPREAYFEEVQEARNFLYDEYKWHAPSKEAIELAFDSILQEKMKVRNKFGFKPPRTGRKTDVEGEPERLSLLQKLKQRLEPSVPFPTLVNDGSIFVILGLWAAWQSSSADPTLPIGAAIAFSVYRLFDKRKKRTPDGPFFGGSPVWGAVGTTFLGLFFGFLVSTVVARTVPVALASQQVGIGLFLTTVVVGATSIFLR